ncbi:MAG TPA: L-threonylcarbamoyladenylate synthase, partial [Actinomycetota bacterium]
AATNRLFEAKGRPRELELPVLVPSVESAREIAAFDERAEVLAARFWGGPLTIVLPRTAASRDWELGGDPETIGVRLPKHPIALELLMLTGPMAVTSANRSGEPTPGTGAEIERLFGDAVSVYFGRGESLTQLPSTVVDLAHGIPVILRAGVIGEREVIDALERVPPPTPRDR